MSVPLAWSASGLPIGIHFSAPVGEERRLLELAYELEEARPWAARVPGVNAG
jgi:amidase